MLLIDNRLVATIPGPRQRANNQNSISCLARNDAESVSVLPGFLFAQNI